MATTEYAPSSSVLLIEDGEPMGKVICRTLRELGLEPVWMVKLDWAYLNGDGFRGEKVADDTSENLALRRFRGSWTDYCLVLVDGVQGQNATDEEGPHGWHEVPFIVQAGVPCIAISSVPENNTVMMELGANGQIASKDIQDAFRKELVKMLEGLSILAISQ